MQINEAVKQIMKEKGVTQNQMANIFNMKTANQMSARMSKTNWTTNVIIDFLDVLGYELVLKPVAKGKRPEGEYKIDRSE